MAQRSEAQIIEMFHLLFLRVLAANNASWFTLKGGANLRYFFGSPRYSNDIDLDFVGREAWGVARTVDSVLSGRALDVLMGAVQLGIEEYSSPKQTETTLRWKFGLRSPEHHDLVRTKIEFSGRGNDSDDVEFAVVPDTIVGPYGVHAPTVRHYRQTEAISQKIGALANRSETKARDIFDLDHLFRQRRANPPGHGEPNSNHAAAAAERALAVPFASFVTEVAPFLDPEVAELYDETGWDITCLALAETLEALASEDGS